MDLAYDGGPFRGWAVQPGLPTVQGVLEEALGILLRRPVRLTVAGRTDAGVHARGQVVHFDVTPGEWQGLGRGRDIGPAGALQRRLGGVLRTVLKRAVGHETAVRAVVVHAVSLAPAGFDARFSALWRRYSYRIADQPRLWDPLSRRHTLWHREPLNIEDLNGGAASLLGLHDFEAFCKPREGASTVRELQRFEFIRAADGAMIATVQADAFCHNMVRALVGACLRVGSGEAAPDWLRERLVARRKDAKSLLAPAHPLVLEEVRYTDDAGLQARADLTRAPRAQFYRRSSES
jgi:tRNA pseudouridine38-40 synthase